MALDPILQSIIDNTAASGRGGSLTEGSVEEARNGYLMMRAIGGDDAPLASVEDRTIGGPDGNEIGLRIYTPEGDGPFAVCVYFHGGGFTIGSIEGHDPVTRRLASDSGCIVVSVEYRLAPEHPFPAAVDDAFAALQWVGENAAAIGGVDGAPLAVAGDSAGGCLAAVSAIMARDAGGPAVSFQLLIYPTTDSTGSFPSTVENAEGPFLTKASMDWFYDNYKPDVDDWRASPIKRDDLSGLPKALVVTGQYDPLRDEGEAYGERLRDAGVPVTVKRYETMPHVFVQMWAILPTAKECMSLIAGELRAALAP